MATAEVSQLFKEIRRNGFQVEVGDGGVAKVLWKGEQVFKAEQDGGTPLTIHSTPSDSRWRKNMVPILIRAKVLETDPWANHTPKKLDTTPDPNARGFLERQLIPWIQRRYDEGFTQAVLANAIVTRWPDIAPTQNSVAVMLSKIMKGGQKTLTGTKHKAWKEVVEGWSKQPALPPPPKQPKNGNGEVVSIETGETLKGAQTRARKDKLTKPSIPLSARCLAMMMDSYPDQDAALLLHLEIVELEERVYS